MKIERRKTRLAEVYTASLNDIMFFLLLFFPDYLHDGHAGGAEGDAAAFEHGREGDYQKEYHAGGHGRPSVFHRRPESGVQGDRAGAGLDGQEQEEGNAEIEYVVLLQADMSLNLQPVVDLIDIANRLQLKMLLFVEKKIAG